VDRVPVVSRGSQPGAPVVEPTDNRPVMPADLGQAVAVPQQPAALEVIASPDGGTSTVSSTSLTVATEAITVVSSGTAMSCGRAVDRVDLVSMGDAKEGIHKFVAQDERVLDMIVASKSFGMPGKPRPEVVAVGRFVFDGGRGIHGIAGDVQMISGTFIVAGARTDRIEVVVNEYRPIVLSLAALERGEHYVGNVQLRWVGNGPADRSLRVSVQGTGASSAQLRLFPMACGRDGKWQAAYSHADEIPAAERGDSVFKHVSATRYRIAGYASGADAAWTEVNAHESHSPAAILPLVPEHKVRVETASGVQDVALSEPWKPFPASSLWFKPGRDVGSLCLDFADNWIARPVSEPVATAQPLPMQDLVKYGTLHCLKFDTTMVFQSLMSTKWVAAKFTH
jgi:hypothetical protein